ncbi:hypothetical protein AC096_08670 [Vibrio cholerae]|nr:hypothetical protein AC096_08670 [Vibrio cholerae]HAS7302410.1 hypothetical protein [Vibrio cholerae]
MLLLSDVERGWLIIQELKLGNGLLPFLIRFLNALLAPPQPLGKPVGRQSHIAQSSLLAWLSGAYKDVVAKAIIAIAGTKYFIWFS